MSDMVKVKGFKRAMILLLLVMASGLVNAGKKWEKQDHHVHGNLIGDSTPKSQVNRLDVVCSKDHMTVNMQFDHPFYGVVFSHPGPHHEKCFHVGPRAGVTEVSFHIRYDSCGTVEDLRGQFHENTIIIQYGEDILEAWDEAKRLRCEWLESFEKQSSKPTLAISDIDIVELNFQGDDIDCWMEVQEGKGPWARQVGGLVPIGSPLTLVIAINDNSREFDMRVKKCTASDGSGNEVQLTDETGCVLRKSLLTPFAKIRDFGGKATLVAYSHLFAFKFPDTLDVFVHCIVEVCRHGCPDSCDRRLLTDQYPSPREPFHTLESKKHQKLVELSQSKPHGTFHSLESKKHEKVVEVPPSKPASIHNIEVSHHRKRPLYLTKVPVQVLKSLPGRERTRDHLISSAQETRQVHLAKNFTSSSLVGQTDIKIPNSPSAVRYGQKIPKHSGETSDSAGNTYSAPKEHDIKNKKEHIVNSDIKTSATHNIEKPVSVGQFHRIIGHDAHWNAEEIDKSSDLYLKHHIPSLKDISYNPPQPEPSAWSADEVKLLTKQEVFHPHNVPHLQQNFQNNPHQNQKQGHLNSQSIPQPEPSAWTADEVKPLTKHEAFHLHGAPHLKLNPHFNEPSHHIKESPNVQHVPQPEPAAVWSADEVKPLTKQEVFRQHSGALTNPNANTFVNNPSFFKSSEPNTNDEIFPNFHPPQVPNLEPWAHKEVHPMHKPQSDHSFLKKEHFEEPEPAAWTLDEVKPLTKEDLKAHSLNYKLKSHSQNIDSLPIYKESVYPYAPTPSSPPEPVYVSKHTISPMNNMSAQMMSKMMMMMPTLLPFTYQTARWPQKTTSRFLRPDRQNFPYPIPQFTHKQQLMMSVVADRRMDSNEDITYEDNPSVDRRMDNDELGDIIQPRDSKVSDQMLNAKETSNDKPDVHVAVKVTETPGYVSMANPTLPSLGTEDTLTDSTNPASSNQLVNSPPAVRPPISGFVPPKLDETGMDDRPDTKDRAAYAPRALNRQKRSSEPVFGVRQKFQAIAPSDLAFEFNLTKENTAVYRGRREEIIYGICMSPAGMSASVGFILILTLLSIIASLVLYEHSWRLGNKTSHLSLLTRTFNGRLEALYRIPAQRHTVSRRDIS